MARVVIDRGNGGLKYLDPAPLDQYDRERERKRGEGWEDRSIWWWTCRHSTSVCTCRGYEGGSGFPGGGHLIFLYWCCENPDLWVSFAWHLNHLLSRASSTLSIVASLFSNDCQWIWDRVVPVEWRQTSKKAVHILFRSSNRVLC